MELSSVSNFLFSCMSFAFLLRTVCIRPMQHDSPIGGNVTHYMLLYNVPLCEIGFRKFSRFQCFHHVLSPADLVIK